MRGLRRRLGWLGVTLALAGAGLILVLSWAGPGAVGPEPAAADEAVTWPSITFTEAVTGLTEPVHVTHAGDGSGRVFIVEKAGRIRIAESGVLASTPFLSIEDRVESRGSEQGLFSVAFPAGYETKGAFYVNYTDLNGDTVVARYRVTADPNVADSGSEEVIFTQAQPFPNHNGGQLAFGSDGYLYIGMGDGGSAGDPDGYAQNPASLLGKMLRIDVALPAPPEPGFTATYTTYLPLMTGGGAAFPYRIPPSNPYTETAGYRDEIWALGLRNPWRFSFDRATGDLYIGDVGQAGYEEINFQPVDSGGGENYGWNIMEGKHCYPSPPCDQSGLVLPVVEYDHSLGLSVTGGFVYRGSGNPGMGGIYFYGDYGTGRIWGLVYEDGAWASQELADTDLTITSFGENEAGNLYVADFAEGTIYEITEAP